MNSPLTALRAAMAQHSMSAYLVPTSDFHASEYVGSYFKARKHFSGFTGSAGTLAVGEEHAALFTDGRYFLQAEEELQGSGIELMRMGEPGVPTPEEYLSSLLPAGGVLGLDGRTVSAREGMAYAEAIAKKGGRIVCDADLAGEVWAGRPPLPTAPVFLLEERFCGQHAAEKLAAVRARMAGVGANVHIMTTLTDIAWVFNIRGGDIRYNPVPLCYAVLEEERAYLFIDEAKLPADVQDALNVLGVEVLPYNNVYAFVERYTREDTVLLSTKKINYALYRLLVDRAAVVDADNPAMHLKAIKNQTEQQNLRLAHVKDGVAMAKFLYWLKTNVSRQELSEIAAAQKLDALRCATQGCIGPSFSTIAGYAHHGAIVHYHATPKTDLPLKPAGFVLVDSGGQYYEGTTDITRTVALGPVSAQQKRHFTLVLKGMLALSHAKFPVGCCGFHIDAIARAPLWAEGLDYNHGTGHGIGFFLCVHEPPISIRYKHTARYDTEELKPGMMVSDEPGLYIAGEYGIRTENQLLVREAIKSVHGSFLGFEVLTLVPIDLDAVDVALLGDEARTQLNAYHARVWEAISPHLAGEELAWLRHATRDV